jgi:hypothetical protein
VKHIQCRQKNSPTFLKKKPVNQIESGVQGFCLRKTVFQKTGLEACCNRVWRAKKVHSMSIKRTSIKRTSIKSLLRTHQRSPVQFLGIHAIALRACFGLFWLVFSRIFDYVKSPCLSTEFFSVAACSPTISKVVECRRRGVVSRCKAYRSRVYFAPSRLHLGFSSLHPFVPFCPCSTVLSVFFVRLSIVLCINSHAHFNIFQHFSTFFQRFFSPFSQRFFA